VASSPSGAESLARELGEGGSEAIRALRTALLRVRTQTATTDPIPVSARELRLVALEAGVPFIGFGFIDNSGMIVFGDAIDQSLGVVLGVSTLASAALGNMVSDILGIGLGGFVAHAAGRLGLPTATLTLEQTMSRSVRRARTMGCTIGVVIGCCLGMFPLLFLDDGKAERLKRQRRMDELFVKAVKYIANDVLDAESATLFVVDRETDELWTRASKELSKDVRFPLSTGIVGRCARSGTQIVVTDPYKDPDFNQSVDRSLRTRTNSILCSPVFDREGKVTGVLEVVNKRGGQTFTDQDARVLAALAAHVSVALDEVARQGGWLEVVSSNPLLDALKTHRHNYVRFHSEEPALPKPS
jgi:GAF domain-containing protein